MGDTRDQTLDHLHVKQTLHPMNCGPLLITEVGRQAQDGELARATGVILSGHPRGCGSAQTQLVQGTDVEGATLLHLTTLPLEEVTESSGWTEAQLFWIAIENWLISLVLLVFLQADRKQEGEKRRHKRQG